MKNYKLILLSGCIGAASLLSGCDKFLDKPLENQQRSEEINYSNLAQMYAPVSGVYRAASDDNLVHWIDLSIRCMRDDDYQQAAPSPTDNPELMAIKNFQRDVTIQSYWGLNQSWISYYSLAIAANNALMELDLFAQHIPAGNSADLALNRQYKAEVRFLRAYAHLMASRLFGDVPILSDSGDIARLTTIGKSSFAEVRQFIIDEMNASIPDLEDKRPNESKHIGAVTKYSALLLKAKAAADLAGNNNSSPFWDEVLNATDQIINSNKFSLYGDYYQLFKRPGKLSNESLFELQYSDFGLPAGDIVRPGVDWGTFFRWQGPAGDQRGSAISGAGWVPPSQNIVDFLTNRGDLTRLNTTILHCGIDGDPATFKETPSGDKVYGNTFRIKYFNGKTYLPVSQMTEGRVEYGANNNVRILRYSDALLLNAEAKVRKGQNGDEPFRLVRERVNMSAITGVTLEQILDERRAEFACEWWGERFNDLVRTGRAKQVFGDRFIPGQSEYIPIPQTQIDANTNFR
ncbi:RagB/SusD family nutrient uptake outer membrane protein [Sphingobacterium psychroaquaticum]|uniref:Starch-binding associating with outer membrane n=1 Tax=Sphingobacterium psychroaquaticum TaxID=561061 RepID=A0A1X7I154_9SPHI|nr:RagB/SusD family nutrient uptake outer membrane protein [Sphingobacterium psychroaquaticum]QBQ42018.1 RagB/SusD family nutrient uptake outer membrane protein [Sphingobacterium psychroaquaticum]SMG08051.1 Starch-binding associating with outer membrane [Sphingobacterium psychroaquaticum]